jgi:hypothetical protein
MTKTKKFKIDPLAREHSIRFRYIGGNDYARHVAKAYDLDLAVAAADTDEQVLARVRAYEQAHNIKPVDWPAIGIENRAHEAEFGIAQPIPHKVGRSRH